MDRRELLKLGAGCGVSGAAGIWVGGHYKPALRRYYDRVFPPDASGKPNDADKHGADFYRDVEKIAIRQSRQTKETVAALKKKYEGEVLGKFRVWDLIQRLALCIDPTDTALLCTSQYMHVCQIISSMERRRRA